MSTLDLPPLPEPRPALDAVVAPHRLSMGLSVIPAGEPWLELDADLAADLAEKRRLLAERHAEVFVELPESRAAQREALSCVVAALLRDHSDCYARDGATGLRIHALDERLDLDDRATAPLEIAARSVQEDLCLMEARPQGWCLTAGSVCFPTRWTLAPMLGRPMDGIHERVPGYREQLDASASRFFDGMKDASVYRRSNWSLLDDPALFQPSGKLRTTRREDVDAEKAENAGQRVWLRVETQTLQRLPETGAILFGIRIHRTRLDDVARDPEAARALLGAIATMDPAMQAYKSLALVGDAAVTYLGAQIRLAGDT